MTLIVCMYAILYRAYVWDINNSYNNNNNNSNNNNNNSNNNFIRTKSCSNKHKYTMTNEVQYKTLHL
jgi:hypothetical protein